MYDKRRYLMAFMLAAWFGWNGVAIAAEPVLWNGILPSMTLEQSTAYLVRRYPKIQAENSQVRYVRFYGTAKNSLLHPDQGTIFYPRNWIEPFSSLGLLWKVNNRESADTLFIALQTELALRYSETERYCNMVFYAGPGQWTVVVQHAGFGDRPTNRVGVTYESSEQNLKYLKERAIPLAQNIWREFRNDMNAHESLVYLSTLFPKVEKAPAASGVKDSWVQAEKNPLETGRGFDDPDIAKSSHKADGSFRNLELKWTRSTSNETLKMYEEFQTILAERFKENDRFKNMVFYEGPNGMTVCLLLMSKSQELQIRVSYGYEDFQQIKKDMGRR